VQNESAGVFGAIAQVPEMNEFIGDRIARYGLWYFAMTKGTRGLAARDCTTGAPHARSAPVRLSGAPLFRETLARSAAGL